MLKALARSGCGRQIARSKSHLSGCACCGSYAAGKQCSRDLRGPLVQQRDTHELRMGAVGCLHLPCAAETCVVRLCNRGTHMSCAWALWVTCICSVQQRCVFFAAAPLLCCTRAQRAADTAPSPAAGPQAQLHLPHTPSHTRAIPLRALCPCVCLVPSSACHPSAPSIPAHAS